MRFFLDKHFWAVLLFLLALAIAGTDDYEQELRSSKDVAKESIR